MIVFVKKVLYKTLSQKSFLHWMHRSFYAMYDLGLLKKDPKFKFHYGIKNLIEDDFVIVDLGANLGYFSKNFSRLAKNGKVVSIEPIPAFYETLNYFLGSKKNVEIHNCALGTENGSITMVLPESNGMMRTGLPHIATSDEEKKQHKTAEVTVRKGSELLGSLSKIDYIKCDIEGYERFVFDEIKEVVGAKRPIVQIEIAPENEIYLLDYFKQLDYIQYGIKKFKFIRDMLPQQEQGDFLFVPIEKSLELDEKLKKRGVLN